MAIKTWYRASVRRRRRGCPRARGLRQRRQEGVRSATPSPAPRTATLPTNGGARRENGDQTQTIRDAINGSGARNVSCCSATAWATPRSPSPATTRKARAAASPGLDALPLTGQYTTYALNKDGKPDYVTDSAASGTGWATGTKTYNGALGIDIKGAPQKTILELAKAQGFATGDITTSEIQDATPAALFSHISERDCYGPKRRPRTAPSETPRERRPGLGHRAAARPRGPTSRWAAAPRPSRRPRPAGDYKGKTLEVQAKERGYQIVRTASELADVSKADQDAPLLGLFADGNMPVRWTGPAAVRQGYLQPAAKCTDNPERGADVPKLADMTHEGHRPARGAHRRAQ